MDAVDTTLLPGEAAACATPEDAEHWLAVYAELVGRLRSHGVRHRRFEERLAHWQRVHAAHAAAPGLRLQHDTTDGEGDADLCSIPSSSTVPSRRCPFARRGVDSPAIRGCPGFRPVSASFPTLHTAPSFARVTCRHLGSERGHRGGYVPVCRLPDGPPISSGGARVVIEVIDREAERAESRG